MSDQSGSSKAKIVGPIIAIGVIAYIALFMTGHSTIAMPLFWALVVFGLVFGRRAKKNRANLGGGQASRTATFPTSAPASSSSVPNSPAPEPTGQTFPIPQPAEPLATTPPPLAPSPAPERTPISEPSVPEPSPAPPPPVAVPALDANSEATAPSPDVVARVAELKKSGRTVDAIEALREATGMELYEASQYIRKL